MRRTRSAILPISIMLLRSLLHSMNVSRRFFPLTTVMGPLASFKVCFEYLLTRLLSRVVLPTPGGPTIATMTGGGSSSGVRLTKGTWSRVWSRSTFRLPCRSARRPDFGANAYIKAVRRNDKEMSRMLNTFSLKPFCFSFPFPLSFFSRCGL